MDTIKKLFDKYGSTVITSLLILVIGIIVSRLIASLAKKAMMRTKMDKTAASFLHSVIKIGLYAIVIVMTLSKLGVPTTSIIAVLSAAGLAVSLALKENLSNVAGGFILMLTHPFRIGNYIKIGESEGFVNEISMMYTKLLTIDNRAVMIPNATVTNSVILNFTNEEKRRLEEHFSIAYSADFNKAAEIIRGVLKNDERTLTYPDPPMIVMDSHNESSIGILVRVWIIQSDYWSYHYDLLKNVKEAFDTNGVSIPFNQLDVHFDAPPAAKK